MLIRPARVDDVHVLYELLRESAAEQGGLQSLCATPENLTEDGFGPAPRFEALLADVDGAAVGLVLYHYIYSTWTSRNNLYVEDLYVRPGFRRQGAAREMMRALARVGGEESCQRMIWLVLRNNPAVRFYRGLGAVAMEEWMPMDLKAPAIDSLMQPIALEDKR